MIGLAALALAVALPLAPPPATSDGVARFAVVIGANDGGPGRDPLRWAVRDAERIAAVLGELGSVPAAHATLLRDPTRADLDAALALATGRIVQARAGGRRTELIVYYSGHADPGGLLLGSQRFDYALLRARLDAVPADVRVVVLDACASGAMLRAKGGTPTAPFVDVGAATGHAYLASAAADEVAQESDRLQASFFTHHFVAGLRGAADASGDGRVTLTEAYEHAFRETLSGTAETLSGPQHASYDIQLAGHGDLVLTELAGSARLVLAAPLAGRAFVRDGAGRLVGEVGKVAGVAVPFGLEPGRYRVALVVDRRVLAADVTVAAGAERVVDRAVLRDVGPALETRERGGTLLVDALPRPERTSVIRIALVPLLGFEGWGDDLVVRGLDLGLLADRVAAVRGVQLAPLYAEAGEVVGLQLGAVAIAHGAVRGAQVGLVTYARSLDGVALAPFPWVADGLHGVETWADTRGGIDLGYRLGPRHLYVAGSVGWRPGQGACGRPGLGVAFGTRADLGPLTLDLDLGLRLALAGCAGEHELASRALVGLPLAGGLAIFAGAGVAGTKSGDGTAFGLLGLRFER